MRNLALSNLAFIVALSGCSTAPRALESTGTSRLPILDTLLAAVCAEGGPVVLHHAVALDDLLAPVRCGERPRSGWRCLVENDAVRAHVAKAMEQARCNVVDVAPNVLDSAPFPILSDELLSVISVSSDLRGLRHVFLAATSGSNPEVRVYLGDSATSRPEFIGSAPTTVRPSTPLPQRSFPLATEIDDARLIAVLEMRGSAVVWLDGASVRSSDAPSAQRKGMRCVEALPTTPTWLAEEIRARYLSSIDGRVYVFASPFADLPRMPTGTPTLADCGRFLRFDVRRANVAPALDEAVAGRVFVVTGRTFAEAPVKAGAGSRADERTGTVEVAPAERFLVLAPRTAPIVRVEVRGELRRELRHLVEEEVTSALAKVARYSDVRVVFGAKDPAGPGSGDVAIVIDVDVRSLDSGGDVAFRATVSMSVLDGGGLILAQRGEERGADSCKEDVPQSDVERRALKRALQKLEVNDVVQAALGETGVQIR